MVGSGYPKASAERMAFSRLDLLAVVFSAGLVVVAFNTVLGSPETGSYKLVCMENLRRICQATTMYAGDNEGELPYPSWGESGTGSKVCWLYQYHSKQVNGTRHVVEEGSLWPYLGKRNIYLCPSEQTNTRDFNYRIQKESSYAMNGAACGFVSSIGGVLGATYKISQFTPDAVSFWEADEGLPFYFNDGSNHPGEGLSQRHGVGVIGTFGGSVELMVFEEYLRLSGLTGAGREVRPGRFWCNPGKADGGI